MPDEKATKPTAPETDKAGRHKHTALTAEEAAKRVFRQSYKRNAKGEIVKDEKGEPVMERHPIRADEVMSFAEYADKIVVVTTSGEKLAAAKR